MHRRVRSTSGRAGGDLMRRVSNSSGFSDSVHRVVAPALLLAVALVSLVGCGGEVDDARHLRRMVTLKDVVGGYRLDNESRLAIARRRESLLGVDYRGSASDRRAMALIQFGRDGLVSCREGLPWDPSATTQKLTVNSRGEISAYRHDGGRLIVLLQWTDDDRIVVNEILGYSAASIRPSKYVLRRVRTGESDSSGSDNVIEHR